VTSQDIKRHADAFLAASLAPLRNLPFSVLAKWPDYPAEAPVDLQVPSELSSYTFTLMKDTLPTGEIRIAIQRYRHRFLGIGEMTANGFAAAPDGSVRPLSDQDVWDLT
jgi:hypothetical protein